MTFTQCQGCASPACIANGECCFPKEVTTPIAWGLLNPTTGKLGSTLWASEASAKQGQATQANRLHLTVVPLFLGDRVEPAATTDLLAACRELVSIRDWMVEVGRACEGKMTKALLIECAERQAKAIPAARAAIAKAMGRPAPAAPNDRAAEGPEPLPEPLPPKTEGA